jgi:hypothetical protein
MEGRRWGALGGFGGSLDPRDECRCEVTLQQIVVARATVNDYETDPPETVKP